LLFKQCYLHCKLNYKMKNFFNHFLKQKNRVYLSIILALLLTIVVSKTVFTPNQPEIQTNLVARVVESLKTVAGAPKNALLALKDRLQKQPETIYKELPHEKLETGPHTTPYAANPAYPTFEPKNVVPTSQIQDDLFFQPLASGVYAATDFRTSKKYIKIEAGTVVEIQEYTLQDGRQISVITPVNK